MRFRILVLLLVVTSVMHIDFVASDLSSLTAEQKEVRAQVDDVTDKIMEYENDINEIKADIEENDAKIAEIEDDKDEQLQKIDDSKVNLDETLLMMQKLNNTNALSTFFYVENELDNNYFLKLENINKMFDSVAADMMVFVDNINNLDADIKEVEKLQEKNDEKLEKMQTKIDEQTEIETQLKQELADLEEEIGEFAVTTSGSSSSSDKESIMASAGISSSDYTYVNYIVSKESGWNSSAQNASSGAYGLCQSLPGSKMASAGSDWQTNAVTQMKWCNSYATSRYGSWASAYSFWISNHWW